MAVTDHKLIYAIAPDDFANQIAAAIADSWQPFGDSFQMGTFTCREMVKGAPDSNNLASASAAVADGDTIAVQNSAGADSHNATATVANNAISAIKFPATVAMVDNVDTVTVKNSAGSSIAGTHSASVASGVLSNVTLASTVAAVVNGGTLTGVTPSGTYVDTITFTVANGVITAIALS